MVGLLLAGGAGRRAGGPKVLRHDSDGTSWLSRAISTMLDGGCDRVLVVLGAGFGEAQRLVPDDARVSTVQATDWADGLGASLRTGLGAAAALHPDAVLIHVVDLPDVTPAVVRRVLDVGVTSDVLARAFYVASPGHPVLVGSAHLAALTDQVSGDRGAQDFLARHRVRAVPCEDLATGRDDDGPPLSSSPQPDLGCTSPHRED